MEVYSNIIIIYRIAKWLWHACTCIWMQDDCRLIIDILKHVPSWIPIISDLTLVFWMYVTSISISSLNISWNLVTVAISCQLELVSKGCSHLPHLYKCGHAMMLTQLLYTLELFHLGHICIWCSTLSDCLLQSSFCCLYSATSTTSFVAFGAQHVPSLLNCCSNIWSLCPSCCCWSSCMATSICSLQAGCCLCVLMVHMYGLHFPPQQWITAWIHAQEKLAIWPSNSDLFCPRRAIIN